MGVLDSRVHSKTSDCYIGNYEASQHRGLTCKHGKEYCMKIQKQRIQLLCCSRRTLQNRNCSF